MVRHIGRYEITGKLGDGGFGSVYRAYDPTVERIVAIKVLSSSTQGDISLINRFRSEAMTAGNLHHKNIVTIYEFGEDNGAPFLAMEYLDGVDLQQIIANKSERESLTLLEKLEIISQAAQGLQCAHENGVVHRDVKPANIMRLKDGSVKIMDFGIARLTNAASTRLTQTGLMIGTVHYMAPEQFKSGEVDALCDIWSYGVVFYELLTGVLPFGADDPAGVMYRITMEEPAPVSSLVPDCPPVLAANLHRLLSKDRNNRVQSLDDFLLDIEPVIASLAKAEIPELLKRADRLIEEDDIDGAQPVIGRLLKLDRANKEVRRLREHWRERVRLQAIRPRIDVLVREADERAESRDFAAALEKLNSAMRLDPGSSTLRSRLDQIREGEERARRADEAISRGRRSLNEGDLTGAFTHFSVALESDPENSQGPTLLEEARHAMRERGTRAQVRAGIAEANNLILVNAYDDAIAILADLNEKNSSDQQVARRLVEARQLKQAHDVKDRLNAGINASRELLKAGNYEQACMTLEALDREHPNSPAIEVLLTHARERLRAGKLANEIESLLAEAREQRDSGRFDEALECVRRALKLDPPNITAVALQRIFLDEAQADADRRKIDSELEQYQSLIKAEKLEEALELIDCLAADHPGEARILHAKVAVEETIKRREEARRLKVQKEIQEAERLLVDRRPESATRLLEDLTIQYPSEAAVKDLLDRARRLKQSQEEQDRLNAGLNSARQMLLGGSFDDALCALEELDRRHPQNAAVEVLLSHARERIKIEGIARQVESFLAEARDQQARGRFEHALQFVQRALELNPANSEALALHKTLLDERQAHHSKGKIAAELQKLQNLIKEEKLDQALADVERLVVAFPQNQRIVEAKQDIANRIRNRDEQGARQIRRGLDEAERMLADGRAGTAAQLLAELIPHFPHESSLSRLLERARQLEREQAAKEDIRRNISAVHEFVSQRDWDQALALISRLRDLQPDCREYLEQADHIHRLEECDRELSAVEAALKTGDLEQGISMAEAAFAKFPGEPRAAAAIQTARNLRELNGLALYARRRVANGDLDEARQLVMEGRARFPDSAELREIESAIERARGLEQSLRSPRQALQKRCFDEAKELLKPLLGSEIAARSLLQEIETQQREYERKQAYDRGRAEAENLLHTLQFETAIGKLQQLLLDFPGDNALREDIARASTARHQHARREKYHHVRAESQNLLEQGSLGEAISILEDLLEEFPNDPVITADVEAIRTAKLLREARIRMDALIAELDALFRIGDAEGVRRGAMEILSQHKEPRASELLDWAERSIAQTTEIRRKSRSYSPEAKWAAVAGAVLLAVVAIILWISLRGPKKFAVEPATIVFSYQKGDPAPKSQPIHIETGSPAQPWRIANSDSWLRLSRLAGTGTADLDATLDTSTLSAGEHVSTATVTSGRNHQSLRIQVRVTESPGQRLLPLPPAGEIKVEPAEMTFEYQKKGPLPEPKRLRIATASPDQSWTITRSDAWLLITKFAGKGTMNLDLSIDPSKLDTGEYRNVVRVNSASGSKAIPVSLKITDPPVVVPDAVDCNAPGWTGSSPGTFFWKGGVLADKATLTIVDGTASIGQITGRPLPGCEVSIAKVPGLIISEPFAASNFRVISVTNTSGREKTSFQITWTVVKDSNDRRR